MNEQRRAFPWIAVLATAASMAMMACGASSQGGGQGASAEAGAGGGGGAGAEGGTGTGAGGGADSGAGADARAGAAADAGTDAAPGVVADAGPDAPATHAIKWHPGHYMASNDDLKGGSTYASSGAQYELADLNGHPNVLGYLIYVSWGHLEPAKDQYDFSVLDQILATLTTGLDQPKRLVIHFIPGVATGGATTAGQGDFRYVPEYILEDPATYGPGPSDDTSGYGGYYGCQTGGYFANLTNANVMARIAAAFQALGKHYDANPNVEAFVAVNETSNMYPESSAGISNASFVSAIEAMGSAATAAFPTTSVMAQNTWTGTEQESADLESWMVAHRIAPSSPDTVGDVAFDAGIGAPNAGLAWGLQAYLGVADQGVTGVVDLRPKARAMMEVQAPDMGVYQVIAGDYGGPFTPADILHALNDQYRASHAFWTHLTSGSASDVPTAALWPNLAAAVENVPLVATEYPANYP
ncbi:MAG TPA: hypothetical protein VGG39_31535 [Polyangiaceae bacterium]|jgi:hypothetical protein